MTKTADVSTCNTLNGILQAVCVRNTRAVQFHGTRANSRKENGITFLDFYETDSSSTA